MDRKIVKPAQDGGRIWNPEHGRFLPAEGLEVQMTPYWLGLVERKDIVASDLPAKPEDPAGPLTEMVLPATADATAEAAPAT